MEKKTKQQIVRVTRSDPSLVKVTLAQGENALHVGPKKEASAVLTVNRTETCHR